jgi:hypothetical protein
VRMKDACGVGAGTGPRERTGSVPDSEGLVRAGSVLDSWGEGLVRAGSVPDSQGGPTAWLLRD